jgi:CheY-like chemotaxis protein
MKTILIVDDSAVDRTLAGGCLKDSDFQILYAKSGDEALLTIGQTHVDLVLTDLVMPGVDGLELVERIRKQHRGIPVVLMTAHGNEEIAVKALKAGAASYVPKKNLARDLSETIDGVIAVALSERAEMEILESLTEVKLRFELGNDLKTLRPLIKLMQGHLRQLGTFDETDVIRVSTALQEALINAIEHGNLELDSKLRELRDNTYPKLGAERRMQSPYCDRKVIVACHLSRDEASWSIRDEGPGFDPGLLPDPRDPANLQRVSGRGLLLIRTFMDEVDFSAHANEIRMVKRRCVADSATE